MQWRGLQCHFTTDPSCFNLHYLMGIQVTAVTGALISIYLLTRYSDGAIYSAIISSVSFPLTVVFWTMFTFDPDFQWAPRFTKTTAFAIGGLVVMVPAVAIYNWLSLRSDKSEEDTSETQSNASESESDVKPVFSVTKL